MEKYLNWTNGGTKAVCVRRSGERSERPSYSQKLAEELFVWLWSSAKPFHTAEPPRTHAHPPRTCQNHRRPKASVQPAVLTLYMGGEKERGGGLKLHIILVFIIFHGRAKAWTLGLFVCVCLLCPPTPSPPPRLLSAERIRLWASTFAEEYHCANSSLFKSVPVPLLLLLLEGGGGGGGAAAVEGRVPPS